LKYQIVLIILLDGAFLLILIVALQTFLAISNRERKLSLNILLIFASPLDTDVFKTSDTDSLATPTSYVFGTVPGVRRTVDGAIHSRKMP
jgi:uncharacterized membrane protein YoaK (UPF0700 family)